jgi:phosphopantetheinyl transferase (holo-ACP synthase)
MRIPFNIGTDICYIPRIYRLLTENGLHGGKRLLGKVLNDREMEAEREKVAQLWEKPSELATWVAGR